MSIVRRIGADVVNARNHGMRPAASAVVNKRGLRAAYARAKRVGRDLYIPPGTYRIDATNTFTGGNGGLYIDQDILIFGAGPARTKLKLTNWKKTEGGVLFWVVGGVKADFADLTIEGPDSIDHNDVGSENYICFGILALGDLARVRCHNYAQTGFNQGIKMSYSTGKSGSVELYGCHMRSRGMHVLHTEGAPGALDPDHTRLIVRDTAFEHDTETMRNPAGNAIQHCLYVGRGVTLDIADSLFISAGVGSSSYGITHFGGVGTPRKASVKNTIFLEGVKNAYSTASTANSEVIDCAFEALDAAVVPLGPVTITNSIFFGRGRLNDGNGAPVNLTVENCDFLTYAPSGSPAGVADITITQPGLQTWYVKNCRFHDVAPAYSNLFLNGGPDPRMVVEDCQFYTTHGTSPIRAHAGHLDVINVQNLGPKPLLLRSDGGVLEVTISGYIQNRVGYSVDVTPVYDNAIFVRGAENYWTSGPAINAPVGKIHGNLHLRRGMAPLPVTDWAPSTVVTVGDLRHANGSVYECATAGTSASGGTGPNGRGTAIADGTCVWRYVRYHEGGYVWQAGPATLTINWLYDFWLIDIAGVQTIDTLHLPAPSGNSDALCGSIVYLVARQPFALGGNGNMIAAAGARPVNSIVSLRYWPAVGKWIEV